MIWVISTIKYNQAKQIIPTPYMLKLTEITLSCKSLSYQERTFISENVCFDIPRLLRPTIDFVRKLRQEPNNNVFDIEMVQRKIVSKETQRRALLTKQLILRQEKVRLLTICLDLKCNSQQKNEAEIMHLEVQKCNVKVR